MFLSYPLLYAYNVVLVSDKFVVFDFKVFLSYGEILVVSFLYFSMSPCLCSAQTEEK